MVSKVWSQILKIILMNDSIIVVFHTTLSEIFVRARLRQRQIRKHWHKFPVITTQAYEAKKLLRGCRLDIRFKLSNTTLRYRKTTLTHNITKKFKLCATPQHLDCFTVSPWSFNAQHSRKMRPGLRENNYIIHVGDEKA